jgi:hypothetical protein
MEPRAQYHGSLQDCSLDQLNQVYIFTAYFSKLHLNVVFFMPVCVKWSLLDEKYKL